MEPIRYEWDDRKEAENLAARGIAFEAIRRLDWAASVATVDDRQPYGEVRILAFGPLDGRLHAVVCTTRGNTRRIISLRKANRREQAKYAAALLARLASR